MTLDGNRMVVFRKPVSAKIPAGQTDVSVWVRIVQRSDVLEGQAPGIRCTVYFDDFPYWTDGSKVDGTTRIVWPERLSKATQLNSPKRDFSGLEAQADFVDEI